MKDNVLTDKKWEFDENVTQCFNDMLERSIPQYTVMRNLVNTIGFSYVQKNTNIIDIGCSNGNAIEPFIRKYQNENTYHLLEVSEPMIKECEKKFDSYIKSDIVKLKNYDLRNGIDIKNTSVVLSILTLQFTPIEYRQKIISSIYNSLNKNGVLILVEKVLGNNYQLDDLFVEKYYDMKKENQYSQEQIMNKRKSLEGVLVPITSNWNVELLKDAGFSSIDCFWKCLNFAGWIAIKN